MKPLFRLHLAIVLALALLVSAIGPAAADEAAQPAVETDAAATVPAPDATEGDATDADEDCGCGARSPGQLLETQRDVNQAITADPGS